MALKVPGSRPGRAVTGTVAQLVERQQTVRGCFSTFCRRRSPRTLCQDMLETAGQ